MLQNPSFKQSSKLILAVVSSYSAASYVRNQRNFLNPSYLKCSYSKYLSSAKARFGGSDGLLFNENIQRFHQNFIPLNFHTCVAHGNQRNQDVTDKSKTQDENSEENLSLIQKFKLMYKRYWYVLIPVHCVTSVVWYGSFFFAAKSGFDIVPWLEYVEANENVVSYMKNSNAGYYGIAYAMYKIATPARYTVTLGGTTISINYLRIKGYIKPVPTKEEFKVMYEDKKDELKERKEEMKEKYEEKKTEIIVRYQDKADEMKEKYVEKKTEMIEKYQDKADEMKEKYQESKDKIMKKLDQNDSKNKR